jgi:hypothetical protein
MTHDELLDKITNRTELEDCWMALRKVVELHKATEATPPWAYEKYLACSVCEIHTNDGAYFLEYPCPTIQVITEQLR